MDPFERNGFSLVEDGTTSSRRFGIYDHWHNRGTFVDLTKSQAIKGIEAFADVSTEEEFEAVWWSLARDFGFWLGLSDAAERLGVADSTLRNQLRNGRISGRKVGNTWVIYADELDRYRVESVGRPGRHAAS